MRIPVGYAEYIVTPQAQRNIEAQWSFVANDEGTTKILPDGRSDIIISFKLGLTNKIREIVPIVTGPATKSYVVAYSPGDAWIGLRLHPSHTHLLWGKEVNAAKNVVLRGGELVSRFPGLFDVVDKVDNIEELHAAVSMLYSPTMYSGQKSYVSEAISSLHLSGGRADIDDVAALSSCSSRHLRRMFKSTVGLSTKTYASLVQFHRSLRLIRDQGLTSSAAAFEAGYSDQSHMIRSFQKFGGFSPKNIPTNLSLPGFSLSSS